MTFVEKFIKEDLKYLEEKYGNDFDDDGIALNDLESCENDYCLYGYTCAAENNIMANQSDYVDEDGDDNDGDNDDDDDDDDDIEDGVLDDTLYNTSLDERNSIFTKVTSIQKCNSLNLTENDLVENTNKRKRDSSPSCSQEKHSLQKKQRYSLSSTPHVMSLREKKRKSASISRNGSSDDSELNTKKMKCDSSPNSFHEKHSLQKKHRYNLLCTPREKKRKSASLSRSRSSDDSEFNTKKINCDSLPSCSQEKYSLQKRHEGILSSAPHQMNLRQKKRKTASISTSGSSDDSEFNTKKKNCDSLLNCSQENYSLQKKHQGSLSSAPHQMNLRQKKRKTASILTSRSSDDSEFNTINCDSLPNCSQEKYSLQKKHQGSLSSSPHQMKKKRKTASLSASGSSDDNEFNTKKVTHVSSSSCFRKSYLLRKKHQYSFSSKPHQKKSQQKIGKSASISTGESSDDGEFNDLNFNSSRKSYTCDDHNSDRLPSLNLSITPSWSNASSFKIFSSTSKFLEDDDIF